MIIFKFRIKSIVASVPGSIPPSPDGLFAYAKAAVRKLKLGIFIDISWIYVSSFSCADFCFYPKFFFRIKRSYYKLKISSSENLLISCWNPILFQKVFFQKWLFILKMYKFFIKIYSILLKIIYFELSICSSGIIHRRPAEVGGETQRRRNWLWWVGRVRQCHWRARVAAG